MFQRKAEELVIELFPGLADGEPANDLDLLVSGLSNDLIDDIPTADPRWADNSRSGL